MNYKQQFIYEDEFSNDENLYKKAYEPELPLQTRIEPPVEDSEMTYYEDEQELPLPSKDTVLNNYNTVANPVTGVPEQQPFYEDEPNQDLYQSYIQNNAGATPPAPDAALPYEDESQVNAPQMPVAPNSPQQAPPYEDELDPAIMGGATPDQTPAPAAPMPPQADPMTMAAPSEAPVQDPSAVPPAPQETPPTGDPAAMGTPIPGEPEPEDTTMFDDTYEVDPYVSAYTDEKSPETRVGNSSEVTGGRPISVEDISRINELKKINSQLMRVRGLLEKELKLKYNKVEDKLNEAIEYFRIIISNLDSYVSQVDDIIMKYKRFIMTILTQINILKQQELNEN